MWIIRILIIEYLAKNTRELGEHRTVPDLWYSAQFSQVETFKSRMTDRERTIPLKIK
jgi:hypothetical protein